MTYIFARRRSDDEQVSLTDAERQVLAAAAAGETAVQTAERLHYAESTVRQYRRILLRKLGARTMAQAVKIGLREGLIE